MNVHRKAIFFYPLAGSGMQLKAGLAFVPEGDEFNSRGCNPRIMERTTPNPERVAAVEANATLSGSSGLMRLNRGRCPRLLNSALAGLRAAGSPTDI